MFFAARKQLWLACCPPPLRVLWCRGRWSWLMRMKGHDSTSALWLRSPDISRGSDSRQTSSRSLPRLKKKETSLCSLCQQTIIDVINGRKSDPSFCWRPVLDTAWTFALCHVIQGADTYIYMYVCATRQVLAVVLLSCRKCCVVHQFHNSSICTICFFI